MLKLIFPGVWAAFTHVRGIQVYICIYRIAALFAFIKYSAFIRIRAPNIAKKKKRRKENPKAVALIFPLLGLSDSFLLASSCLAKQS